MLVRKSGLNTSAVSALAPVPNMRPPHVRCERFPGATQVHRIHSRQIVPPEAELGHDKEPRQEDADFQGHQVVDPPRHFSRRRIQVHQRNDEQGRYLEQPQQFAATDDSQCQECEGKSSDQPTDFLPQLHLADNALLLPAQRADLRFEFLGRWRRGVFLDKFVEVLAHFRERCPSLVEAGNDLRRELNRTKGRTVAAREEKRRDDRRLTVRGGEQTRHAGTGQRPLLTFLLPDRGFRQEGTDENQRQRGDHARDQRVSPGVVVAIDRRNESPYLTHSPYAMVTSKPPTDENACV